MRLRGVQGNITSKQEALEEIEELEQKIQQSRQTLSGEVGEERLEQERPTSKRWQTINEDTDKMQAKWKWIEQLNQRIAKGKHPCQDFGPRSATPAMLVEIQ